jgi:hypothetical protein
MCDVVCLLPTSEQISHLENNTGQGVQKRVSFKVELGALFVHLDFH